MKKFLFISILSVVIVFGLNAYSKEDQAFSIVNIESHLRSWKAGSSKEKIVAFVNSVSDPITITLFRLNTVRHFSIWMEQSYVRSPII
jgi:hypothetical protein